MARFELTDDGVKVRCLTAWLHPYIKIVKLQTDVWSLTYLLKWGGWSGSNRRPPGPQPGTLTNWATSTIFGTVGGIRTPDLLLRRQLLYPTELQPRIVERVMGIEPTRPAWKAGILPLNYTRVLSQQPIFYHNTILLSRTFFENIGKFYINFPIQ